MIRFFNRKRIGQGIAARDSGIRYGKLKANAYAALADEENTDSLEGLGSSKLFYAR